MDVVNGIGLLLQVVGILAAAAGASEIRRDLTGVGRRVRARGRRGVGSLSAWAVRWWARLLRRPDTLTVGGALSASGSLSVARVSVHPAPIRPGTPTREWLRLLSEQMESAYDRLDRAADREAQERTAAIQALRVEMQAREEEAVAETRRGICWVWLGIVASLVGTLLGLAPLLVRLSSS